MLLMTYCNRPESDWHLINRNNFGYSYIEFCDSMVFGVDPRSRLKSELTLSEMRLVLVISRSAIIFLADEAIKHMCWGVLPLIKNKGIKGEN